MTDFLKYGFDSPERKAYNEGYNRALENTFDSTIKSTVEIIASEIATVLDKAATLKVSAQVLYCILMFHADQMMGAIKADAAEHVVIRAKGKVEEGDKDHD